MIIIITLHINVTLYLIYIIYTLHNIYIYKPSAIGLHRARVVPRRDGADRAEVGRHRALAPAVVPAEADEVAIGLHRARVVPPRRDGADRPLAGAMTAPHSPLGPTGRGRNAEGRERGRERRQSEAGRRGNRPGGSVATRFGVFQHIWCHFRPSLKCFTSKMTPKRSKNNKKCV